MLQADRQEFDRQVAVLCAAFNVPVADRADAYWLAFNALRLDTFMRMIAHCLGPDGTEKVPTVAQLWKAHKALRTAHQPAGKAATPEILGALVEAALARWRLSPHQLRTPWNWIADGTSCAVLGVVIPQDLEQPDRWPARRLMLADLEPPRA